MLPPKPVFFISDLHLSPDYPHGLRLLNQFLAHAKGAQAIYILGDFFDMWLGFDINTAFQLEVQKTLRDFVDTQHIPIFIMRGNRDFLMPDDFIQGAHCIPLSDPHVIELSATPVLLTHGDVLCGNDRSYQIYRSFVQHKVVRSIFNRLPKLLRRKIGAFFRKQSKSKSKYITLTKNPFDVTKTEVEKILNNYALNHMIHGHTHHSKVDEFLLNDKVSKRFVLSDWQESMHYLVANSIHDLHLQEFKLKTV